MTALTEASTRTTRDALWGGALTFWQPARGCGYRFNLDPVLLAGFVPPSAHAIDLGAGCGVIGTLLLAEGKAQRITSVEVQEELASLATRNAEENGHSDRHRVLTGDLRTLELPRADCVVFNPPYFRVGEGRSAPDPGRETARRERHGTLSDFVSTAFSSVGSDGQVCAIIRTDRLGELAGAVASLGASLTRIRHVLSRADRDSRLVLVEARHDRLSEPVEETPLIVHDGDRYSAEVRSMLREAD